jgi:RHS repeat-associated protein
MNPIQRAALAASALLLALSGAALAQTPATLTAATPACLWSSGPGEKAALIQYRNDTVLQETRRLSLGNARALAMNGSDCGVWAVADKDVHKLDATGVSEWRTSLKTLGIDKAVRQALIDPADHSLWLVTEKALVRLDRQGRRQSAHDLPDDIRTVAAGLDGRLWAVSRKTLWSIDRQGGITSRPLPKDVDTPSEHLAIDTLGGQAWLVRGKQLVRLPLDAGTSVPAHQRLTESVRQIALDAHTNTLWVAGAKFLRAYRADGQAGSVTELRPLDIGSVRDLVADPVTRGLWLAGSRGLVRFNSQGVAAGRYPLPADQRSDDDDEDDDERDDDDKDDRDDDSPRHRLAAPLLQLQPILVRVRPATLTNDPRPTIGYAYGALCNGAPCDWSPERYAGYRIAATLDGQVIAPFIFEPGTGQASHVPSTSLAEGNHTLSARATDALGQSTPTLTDSFSIDTTPPRFTTLTPASGSYVTTPEVTLTGTVDDAQANVIVSRSGTASVATTPDASGRFQLRLPLAEGPNAIDLVAWDRANNRGSANLTLIRDTLAPVFQSVSATTGQIVRDPRLSLSGRIDDATASIALTDPTRWQATGGQSGSEFDWTLTLQPGPNSVQFVATDVAGNRTTQTVSLTYLPPPPSAPLAEKMVIAAREPGRISLNASAGTVAASLAVAVRNERSGESLQATADSSGEFSLVLAAEDGDTLTVMASDPWEQTSAPTTLTVTLRAKLYFIHADHLGTPRLVTDGNNQPVWRSDPAGDAFGDQAPDEDPQGTGRRFEMPLGFPGQYRDKETGLSYNYFRDYDPGTGRYVQSDPIGLDGGINTYSYVIGNPVSYVDPDGLLGRGPGKGPYPLGQGPGQGLPGFIKGLEEYGVLPSNSRERVCRLSLGLSCQALNATVFVITRGHAPGVGLACTVGVTKICEEPAKKPEQCTSNPQ